MPSYPNRCQHIKVNGTQCGSPALRRNRFCYFHKRHQDERIELNADRAKKSRRRVAIDLPVFEDANSIQVSLMQITRLLIAGDLDTKTAGLVLYALQTASSNLHRTNFDPYMRDVILDPASVGETSLGAHAWADSDFATEEDHKEEDPGIDYARRAGVMKAAEYLYDLDKKSGGIHGFAPKPDPAPSAKPEAKPSPKTEAKKTEAKAAKPDPTATKPETKTDPQTEPPKKSPTRELNPAEVRQQIRLEILKAAPDLLAANPSLIPLLKETAKNSP